MVDQDIYFAQLAGGLPDCSVRTFAGGQFSVDRVGGVGPEREFPRLRRPAPKECGQQLRRPPPLTSVGQSHGPAPSRGPLRSTGRPCLPVASLLHPSANGKDGTPGCVLPGRTLRIMPPPSAVHASGTVPKKKKVEMKGAVALTSPPSSSGRVGQDRRREVVS